MSDEIGKIGWIDITVDDAVGLKDFYSAVTGLVAEEVSMGDYADFNMTLPATGTPVAGICHARGSNAELPAGWLIYFVVADVDEAVREATSRGATLRVPVRDLAGGRFAVIEDPAGGIAALYEA